MRQRRAAPRRALQPPAGTAARLDRAVGERPAPLAVVDLDAFDANAAALRGRAHGLPVRVATKSLRCRGLVERALAQPGFAGLMCYSLREALRWVEGGHTDVLVAYPTVDAGALRELATAPDDVRERAARIAVVADCAEHLDLLAAARRDGGVAPRVVVDVDASYRLGPLHLGARRSPVRTPADVVRLVAAAQERGLEVVGLMFYEAQIAGVPDRPRAVRILKERSHAELVSRRAAVVAAAREVAEISLVNGGGTGSLHLTGQDPSLTELAAGSGFYAPTLFDAYDGLGLVPAAYFALPVVRRPAPDVVTVASGGFVASGPPGTDRLPRPLPEHGVRLLRAEGAGEVQTPLAGPGAARLRVGERVWFRHAKAGELAERFTQLVLVAGDEVVGTAATYRGEGWSFG